MRSHRRAQAEMPRANRILPKKPRKLKRASKPSVISTDLAMRSYSVVMVAACPFPVNYGSPGAIRELAQTLSEMGHNVHIVTYPEGDDLPIGNARLHRAGKAARSKGPQAGPSLRKLWIDLLLV